MEISRIAEKKDILIQTPRTSAFLTTVAQKANQTHYVPKGIVVIAEQDTSKALIIVTVPKDRNTPNAGRFVCSFRDADSDETSEFTCDAIRLYADTIDGEPGYRVTSSSFITDKNPLARHVAFFKGNVLIGDALPTTSVETVFKE